MNAKVKNEEIVPKAALNLKKLTFWQSISLGCDPEFFFTNKDGETIGSEKVIPKGGVVAVDIYNGNRPDPTGSKIVIDGVQAEFNPRSSSCRESLASELSSCFRNLALTLKDKNIKVCVAPLVEVSQTELDSLSEGSRVFGCAPSTNVYQNEKDSAIKVDPKKYLRRSAGGHIHLGNYYSGSLATKEQDLRPEDRGFMGRWAVAKRTEQALKEKPEIMVPILDIIVGNTCVLLDRAAGNKERRANYGRVGEFRLKSYGLEYRTLSNFWLKSYPLLSFVFGMARMAVHLVEQSTKGNDYIQALFDAIDRNDIMKAINENDFDLALSNFKKIVPILEIAAGMDNAATNYYPLRQDTINLFYHFVRRGMDYWFKQDAFTHWTGGYSERGGWERFVLNYVKPDLDALTYTAIDLNDLDPVKKKKKVVLEEVGV